MALTPGLRYLGTLTNYEASGRLRLPTLGRMQAIVGNLGSPHDDLDVIHITGTNGKGSTAAFAAQLLAGAGRRVGLYTSPHLHSVNERIVIDGEPVSEEILDRALLQVADAAERVGEQLSWFEAVTLAAFVIFKQAQVEAAVIEVGMLGHWDATNIVRGRVAVVTNVDMDHADEAGGTPGDIAREKAGIVKHGSTLILGDVDDDLVGIFLDRAPGTFYRCGIELRATNVRETTHGYVADLHTVQSKRRNISIGMRDRHQVGNALLALAAVEAFVGKRLDDEVVRRVLTQVAVPGRCELISTRPRVLLDGAHNPAAARALRSSLRASRGNRVLVIGVLSGRDHGEFLEALGVDDHTVIICTQPDNPRALPAAELAAAVPPSTATVVVEPSLARAGQIAALAAGNDGQVVVTGSMYVLDPLRRSILAVVPATGFEHHKVAVS